MDFKVEAWDVEKLIPYENNVKIHDEKQVKKIAESIKQLVGISRLLLIKTV